jgi:hypothetical protein
MADKSPTKSAEHFFQIAYSRAVTAAGRIPASAKDPTPAAIYDLAAAMSALAKGMSDMAVGLRATYQAIDRLERKLDGLSVR